MAQSIRTKVQDLTQKEEEKKEAKLQKERNIIKDAMDKYAVK